MSSLPQAILTDRCRDHHLRAATQAPLSLSACQINILRCPACHGELEHIGPALICRRAECKAAYEIVRGVPFVLPAGAPMLAFRNDVANRPTQWRRTRQYVRARLPNIVLNVGGRRAIRRFLDILAPEVSAPVILNIGEKHNGPVLRALDAMVSETAGATVLHADCALGPRSALIVDLQHLPFANSSLDAVVIDSGLEHESQPHTAVAEVLRVLKPDGLVYVDLPFMMPVHAGPSDFQRFSSMGVRMLFRDFEAIERGVSCGPAMALTQMMQYTMLSFVRRQWARITVKLVCRFALFWLKYLDVFLVRKPGATDAAGGTYLIARKSNNASSQQEELLQTYRGIVPSMYEPLRADR